MKKKLTITTLVLAFSVVAGSAYAASNNDKIENTQASETTSATKSSEPVNLEEMAKEKGITVEELIAQLEKEGKLTEASEITSATKSSEPVNLEEMAKEKGITVDELIAQLEKEGKLMKAENVTDSMSAEKSNK
ncbi:MULTISPECIES: hypothetical protein [unclassified Lysinibacillus]|uniref:hypothetical protein n=1 Tax=unclassified Lysinibacillus TaxID=2636778 RepID=UPI002555A0AD|nr:MULTISPECIES: hypothetical protein [unclassified Lysinibacillus]MDM5248429.1 hypothetical protein [Lysinibacillus sp. G4S2]